MFACRIYLQSFSVCSDSSKTAIVDVKFSVFFSLSSCVVMFCEAKGLCAPLLTIFSLLFLLVAPL